MADLTRKTANLFDVNGTYSLKSNSITITNNSIAATLGGSATDRIYYTQTYTAGTYKISFDVQSCEGRLYSNKEFTGSTYNSYYEGYYRTITGAQTITFAEDFIIGFILAGPSGLNAVISNIMFQTSTSTAAYEPYGWVHSLRKLTTATEAIENPLYSDGTALTVRTIKGNTVQSGTPTPSNPVAVNGVGERTENFFNIADVITGGDLTVNGDTITKGDTSYNIDIFSGAAGASTTIPTNCMVLDAGDYTIFYNTSQSTSNRLLTVAICPYTSSTMTPEEKYFDKGSGFSFTLSEKSYVTLRISPSSPVTLAQLAITSGSTAPTSYIPYGYKIPISSGQQTIEIYIGDLPLLKSLDGTAFDEISNGTLTRRVDSDGSVLPTPTTTQITMPSITTTEGANSITVDTTVQPSEFTATWTGWHNASVKEWDGSDWQ